MTKVGLKSQPRNGSSVPFKGPCTGDGERSPFLEHLLLGTEVHCMGWGQAATPFSVLGLHPHSLSRLDCSPPATWVIAGSSLSQSHNRSMFLSFSEPLANSCEQQAMHSALWGRSPYDWTRHRRASCSCTRRGTPELRKLLRSSRWEETQGL